MLCSSRRVNKQDNATLLVKLIFLTDESKYELL